MRHLERARYMVVGAVEAKSWLWRVASDIAIYEVRQKRAEQAQKGRE